MTKQEEVRYNIGLTFDFIRACINNPKLLEQVEQFATGTEIVFIEKDQAFPTPKEGAKQQFIKVSHSFEVIETEVVE
jgi:hypothetical protein